MCTYLKNMEGYKINDLKLKDFDSIQEMFNRAFKRVNTFEDYRTELVEGKEKRAVMQENVKNQKLKEFDPLKWDQHEKWASLQWATLQTEPLQFFNLSLKAELEPPGELHSSSSSPPESEEIDLAQTEAVQRVKKGPVQDDGVTHGCKMKKADTSHGTSMKLPKEALHFLSLSTRCIIHEGTTSDHFPLVFEQGHTSDPNIASFSGAHESDPDLFTSTNVEDETLGGSFHTTPLRSTPVPPEVSELVQKVSTLESELKAHKMLFKDVVGKLVKKVKALELKLQTRSRKVVMSAAKRLFEEEHANLERQRAEMRRKR
ncbi:hypothetical protein Tco_0330829 [Tanacetum coccineum]